MKLEIVYYSDIMLHPQISVTTARAVVSTAQLRGWRPPQGDPRPPVYGHHGSMDNGALPHASHTRNLHHTSLCFRVVYDRWASESTPQVCRQAETEETTKDQRLCHGKNQGWPALLETLP